MNADYIDGAWIELRAALARRDSAAAARVIQNVAAADHRDAADRMTRAVIAAGLHPFTADQEKGTRP